MTSSKERLRRILEEALGLSGDERNRYLDQQCLGDPGLREDVENAIRSYESHPGFLEDEGGEEVREGTDEDPPSDDEPPTDPDAELKGFRLGNYLIESEIGRGGMGTVYRARDRRLDIPVALKVIHTGFDPGNREAQRLLREARSVARLRHPGIVRVYTSGITGRWNWFAMELVDGRDLDSELEDLRRHAADRASRPPTILPAFQDRDYLRRVAILVADAAAAIHHAHDCGIIHLDLKPKNLLLDLGGDVKIVDFGLARPTGAPATSRSGGVPGTVHYMSPEVARAAKHPIDRRSDVFSLGVVLYELLTLARPFEGETSREVMDRILSGGARPPKKANPRIPRDLDAICLSAIATQPQDRYASAMDFARDLRRFLGHEAVVARRPGLARRAALMLRRRRRELAVSASTLVVAVLIVAAVARARTIRDVARAVADVRDVLERTDWKSLERGQWGQGIVRVLSSGRESLRVLLSLDGDHPEARDLASRYEGLRVALVKRCENAFASKRSAGVTSVEQFIPFVRMAKDASTVFPEDVSLRAFAGQRAELTVRADSAGTAGVAELARLDPISGEPDAPEHLGALPIVRWLVEPGFYRLTVRFDSEFFESDIEVSIDGSLEIVARPPPADVTRGMVPIAGGTLALREEERTVCTLDKSEIPLRPFWLDTHEVSNSEYERFLIDTGRPPPSFWPSPPERPESWGELPATKVTWDDAAAFAAHRGKRLPTHAEWEFAARGPNGRLLPWTDGRSAKEAGANVDQPFRPPPLTRAAEIEDYLAAVWPVTRLPGGATPDGVLHMYGNVDEWTGSVFVENFRNRLVVMPWKRWSLGGAWSAAQRHQDLSTHGFREISRTSASIAVGFRCARSR